MQRPTRRNLFRTTIISGLAAAALLLSACTAVGGNPNDEDLTPATPRSTAPSARASVSPSPTTPLPSPTGELEAAPVATGLASPWGLAVLTDGRVLVSSRDERTISAIAADGDNHVLTTVEDAVPGGEGGLMGLAVTTDQRTVLAYFTAQDDNRIAAMSWDGRTLGEPRVILGGIPKGGRHNGGRLLIGPDELLYVGTGDAGDRSRAQDSGSLAGKILRLTLDGKPAPGNPFGNEVFSLGHRNVQGLAFDDFGQLWASEFGDQTWDELNLVEAGQNYGWPEVEGTGGDDRYTDPKVVWGTDEASPSGLASWRGSLWMAALRGQSLWQIPVESAVAGEPVSHFNERYGRLRSVAPSADGKTLWLLSSATDGRGSPGDEDDQLLSITWE